HEPAGWSLLCLILWTTGNRPTRDLAGLDAEAIELVARWRGEPGAFTTALVNLRFLDGEAGSYRVHDWAHWQPWVVNRNKRIKKARRAASARWERKNGNRSTKTDGKSTQESLLADDARS